MKVTIFGSGYVGLVTGACLAEVGNHVMCVDTDVAKINLLNSGGIPIFEPGLEALVIKNKNEGRLLFTTNSQEGIDYAELQMIAVGTPSDSDGSADLQYVLAVAKEIGRLMQTPKVVITKSTVPVGTGVTVATAINAELKARKSTLNVDVVSNPEFLKEGAAIDDFMRPDRIVVGTSSAHVIELMRELYEPFNRNHDRLLIMDIRSSELTKYAANALLATKISFMNELSNIAELTGADVEKVRIGIGSDPRIGYHFIYPGAGYGGSCFPKDVRALMNLAETAGYVPAILRSVEAVNLHQKQVLFNKIGTHYHNELSGKTLAIWGLSFKPNTDDMREAASRVLLEKLWAANVTTQVYDPQAMKETKRIYGAKPNIIYCETPEGALEGADALVVMTEWNLFRSPDFVLIKEKLKQPVIFDGRNLYNPTLLKKLGFTYYSIGRAPVIAAAQ